MRADNNITQDGRALERTASQPPRQIRGAVRASFWCGQGIRDQQTSREIVDRGRDQPASYLGNVVVALTSSNSTNTAESCDNLRTDRLPKKKSQGLPDSSDSSEDQQPSRYCTRAVPITPRKSVDITPQSTLWNDGGAMPN
ncbi:hypothetical protein CCHR01_05135 [Colletotrichum chrysophilum]|uniref:Uncharacterized protein n=1 Tax=Colletotrichum chrysophilum TaxID=1836956 RepID=A0AAD9API9_9PEZI|nr:hypothetical protein CCHR01_05135 [Colletotrichum chrysophilum]